MADYEFVSLWRIPAPIEAVWEAIFHSERWTTWWSGLERVVELERGDANCIGCVRRFTWRGWLPYTLVVDMRVTRVEPPVTLESLATGELEGVGTWQLAGEDAGTVARYTWNVRTTKPWMNALAPVARPLFQWNHDAVMRGGEQGLKRLLGVSA